MKAAQVNKLYAKLTPHEQAALAFAAAARQDHQDREAIIASVERKNYVAVHADYDNRVRGLQNLAAEYAMGFWQSQAARFALRERIGRDGGGDDDWQSLSRVMAKLRAMDVALESVCQDLGIGANTIRQATAHIEKFRRGSGQAGDTPVDAGLVARYVEIFREVAMLG